MNELLLAGDFVLSGLGEWMAGKWLQRFLTNIAFV